MADWSCKEMKHLSHHSRMGPIATESRAIMEPLSAMSPTTSPLSCSPLIDNSRHLDADADATAGATAFDESLSLRTAHVRNMSHAQANACGAEFDEGFLADGPWATRSSPVFERSSASGGHRMAAEDDTGLAMSLHYMSPTVSCTPSCDSSASDVDSEPSCDFVQTEYSAMSPTSTPGSDMEMLIASVSKRPPSPVFYPEDMQSMLDEICVISDDSDESDSHHYVDR